MSEKWRCDSCGQDIDSVESGNIEWLRKEVRSGSHEWLWYENCSQ